MSYDLFDSDPQGLRDLDRLDLGDDRQDPPAGDAPTMEDTPLEEDDDEEAMSASDILKVMNEIWLNENASPTLLPHRSEIVEALLSCIRDMQENFANNRDKPEYQLMIQIHQLEVHRITYLVNDYVRARLRKIDFFPEEILREDEKRRRENVPDNRELLSSPEREYVQKRLAADRALLNRAFLNSLPDVLRTIEAPGQDLTVERVFLEVNSEPVNGISMPDMKEPESEFLIDLQPRSRHLLPFLSVRDALEDNQVRLL
ncbi:hypothetical protein L596_012765 [Steinernema carpocapsae]|uniref:DNA replication complex GINS protein SLD5 n=1 Tax=Steinernema carpocapsae TaxID=34508 RepID=A0A4U5NY31_STECR|nr:hypothetical protein L596_012765 [Steinernema carpocapsae]